MRYGSRLEPFPPFAALRLAFLRKTSASAWHRGERSQTHSWRLSALALTGLLCMACDEVSCPAGTPEVAGQCKATAGSAGDLGTATSDSTESGASGSLGNSDATPPATGVQTSAGIGAPEMAANAAASGANAGAAAPPGVGPMSPMSSNDPCAGLAGGVGCEDSMLIRCDQAGTTVSRESCGSPALCQIGLPSEMCASCTPNTYRCMGANLELCSDSGQYAVAKTCESVALCSASAGDCTTEVCVPNAKVCSEEGALQTCNADGTQLMTAEHCGASLCDAKQGKCNKCVPQSVRCDGNDAVECSENGEIETTKTCAVTDDCQASSCMLGKCVTQPKQAGASCASAKLCDGHGKCVGCLSDRDCGANELCKDQMCVVKACSPSSATCTTSGTLQICDSTGERVETTKQCGSRRCNEAGRSCYACVPNEVICSGTTSVKCAADGSGMTETPCTTADECRVAGCASGKCTTTNVARGRSCSGGKCDGNGECVACLEGDVMACNDVPSGQCGPGQRSCRSGQWAACSGKPGTAEVCGGGDEDCDTRVDENATCPSGQTCVDGSCQRECGNGIKRGDEECDSPDDQYGCDPTTCRRRTYYTYCGSNADCIGNSTCYEGNCVMSCGSSGICNDWFGVQGACFQSVCLRVCDVAACPPTMTCNPGADAEAAAVCS